VDRLLRGDLFHTVSTQIVMDRLATFPADWRVAGVGTTNWMKRNGEVICDGTVGEPHFWWADPQAEVIGTLLDVAKESPDEARTRLVTPQYGVDDLKANFPFLAMAVCNPAQTFTLMAPPGVVLHDWLVPFLTDNNWGVVGVQVIGRFTSVKTTDAYNIPLGGLKLEEGYVSDDVFRYGDYGAGQWRMVGVFVANPSLQPLISVPGLPLHLHGFLPDQLVGGHIVQAMTDDVEVTIHPLDDLNLTIHNVAKAMNMVKPTE